MTTPTDTARASATIYRADNIVPAVEAAEKRGVQRLMLANRIGMVVEIMADDLLATISQARAEGAAEERERLRDALTKCITDESHYRFTHRTAALRARVEAINEIVRVALEPKP